MKARVKGRRSDIARKTRETEVEVSLVLDGTGSVDCDIPDQFLRHMVETLSRYSGSDVKVKARGDIDHHLIEDVAIALGRAYRDALGDRPVKRISSATVPMDEALVQVTVDLIDRPFVHLEMPDKMYQHFLRSYAMELRATLHTVIVRGEDTHHIVEATFKALGLALRDAMTPVTEELSTKSKVSWGKGR
jgi:imidazoleglycerol-phosphate dehydratase